jgi:hypothetical protein
VLVHNAGCNDGITNSLHGGIEHDTEINNYINFIRKNGATNIRKHQVQVDVNGNTVGNNLPDVQFDIMRSNGSMVHINVEFDHVISNSIRHRNTILQNDRYSRVFTHIIR